MWSSPSHTSSRRSSPARWRRSSSSCRPAVGGSSITVRTSRSLPTRATTPGGARPALRATSLVATSITRTTIRAAASVRACGAELNLTARSPSRVQQASRRETSDGARDQFDGLARSPGVARLAENSSANSAIVRSLRPVELEEVSLLARIQPRSLAFQLAVGASDRLSLRGYASARGRPELCGRREVLKNILPIGSFGSYTVPPSELERDSRSSFGTTSVFAVPDGGERLLEAGAFAVASCHSVVEVDAIVADAELV